MSKFDKSRPQMRSFHFRGRFFFSREVDFRLPDSSSDSPVARILYSGAIFRDGKIGIYLKHNAELRGR